MPGRRLGGPSYLYCIVAVPFKIHTSTWYTNKMCCAVVPLRFSVCFVILHPFTLQFRNFALRCIFPPLAFVDFGLAAAVKCPTPERFIVGKETRSIFQSKNEVRCSNPFHRPDGIGSSCQVRICLCLPPPSSNFWKQSSNACIFVIVVFHLHSPRHIPIGHQGGGH